MCVTTGPSEMSETLIYTGQHRYAGKDVHVLAYQNNASSIGGLPNAMLLPIPATHSIQKEHLVDTTEFKSFLKDMAASTKFKGKMLGHDSLKKSETQAFKVGSYYIITGSAPSEIFKRIKDVPKECRPSITEEFLQSYADHYVDFQLVLCCWAGDIEAEPILMWYEPKKMHQLFVPMADAHDGAMPRFGEDVRMDHIVMTGRNHPYRENPTNISYADIIPKNIATLLPKCALSTDRIRMQKNGDLEILMNSDGRPITRRYNDHKDRGREMYGWS